MPFRPWGSFGHETRQSAGSKASFTKGFVRFTRVCIKIYRPGSSISRTSHERRWRDGRCVCHSHRCSFSGRPFPSAISTTRVTYNVRACLLPGQSRARTAPNVGRRPRFVNANTGTALVRYPLAHGLRVSSVRCSVFGRRPSSPIKNKLDPLVYCRARAGMAHIFHFFPLSAVRPSPVTPLRKKCNPNKKKRPTVCPLPPCCYGGGGIRALSQRRVG